MHALATVPGLSATDRASLLAAAQRCRLRRAAAPLLARRCPVIHATKLIGRDAAFAAVILLAGLRDPAQVPGPGSSNGGGQEGAEARQ